MELVVKVIGKDIKNEKVSFTAYSLLTSKGNWYRTAKLDTKELEKFVGKVAVVEVSRKFLKRVVVQGEERDYPTLVLEAIYEPTEEQLTKYENELQELNNQTLVDVE